jgi:hypothetical protein
MYRLLCISLLAGAVAACDAPDPNTTRSTETDPNPQIDSDPTPPSSTGGESQANSPDGTSSSVGKPILNQPTPTD